MIPISLVARTFPTRGIAAYSAGKAADSYTQSARNAAHLVVNAAAHATIAASNHAAVANAFDAIAFSEKAVYSSKLIDGTCIWTSVESDAKFLAGGGSVRDHPALWPDDTAGFFFRELDEIKSALRTTHPENWDFWIDWYQAQLDGRPMLPDSDAHWEMLAEIFEVSKTSRLKEEDWEKGADHVNPIIREIYLRYLGQATYNAERIEPNPDTHLLRAIPESDMEPDFLRDTVDRLRDAANIFGDLNSLDNQYRALQPDIEFLLDGIEKYADRPLRLHDTARQVALRLEVRIEQQDCPSAKQDALIADFQTELIGAMADIVQQDDRVRQVVQARLKAALEGADPDQIAALAEGVEKAEIITEGDLKAELREDIETLRDPRATPEATRQALYRLCSRLIRISAQATKLPAELITQITVIGGGIGALGYAVHVVIRLITGAG